LYATEERAKAIPEFELHFYFEQNDGCGHYSNLPGECKQSEQVQLGNLVAARIA
jgi:hypothetical protein